MSTTISSFPITADKLSASTVVTSLLDASYLVAIQSGANAIITKANLVTQLDFQPHDTALDTLSALTPSTLGGNLLQLANPTGSSYVKSSSAGVASLIQVGSVLSDIGAQPRSTNLDEFSTINPSIPGLNILRLDAPSVTGYVQVASGIDSNAFIRTPAQVRSDIGAFATASLDDDSSLGGLLASSGKAASQRATKKYYDARLGIGTSDTPDDTIASSATLALDATNGDQISVTGSIGVTAITLTEKAQKALVFTGAVIITAGASLLLPAGMTTLTTSAGGIAIVKGLAGGVVSILQYYPPAFQINYGGDFTTGGDFFTGGAVTINQTLTTVPAFSVQASNKNHSLTLTVAALTNATLPTGTHTLAAEVGNYSATAQTPAATARTYISGSAISVPSSGLQVGSKFSWKFNLTKTAAGSATSTFDICVGTAGTTADTARVSFTKPAGTAAADEGFVIIEAVIKGPISASGVIAGEFVMYHNLAATGHLTIPMACVHTDSSTFDLTTANLILGVCITSGASDSLTINQVSSQAFNV